VEDKMRKADLLKILKSLESIKESIKFKVQSMKKDRRKKSKREKQDKKRQ